MRFLLLLMVLALACLSHTTEANERDRLRQRVQRTPVRSAPIRDDSNSAPVSVSRGVQSHRRIHARSDVGRRVPAAGVNSAASPSDLTYFGGPIVGGPITVHVLTWGSVNGVNLVPQLSSFLGAVGGTTWWDILLQYSTPNQTISNSSLTVLPPVSLVNLTTTTVDDKLIQSTLVSAINTGHLTLSQNSTDIFAVLFPPSVFITLDGYGSCQVFCAYHGTIVINGVDLGYITFPDQGGACKGGCGASPSVFENSCSVLSHELAETVTDVAVGLVPNGVVAAPLAWFNPVQDEIGDICNAQQATVVGTDGQTYTVQKLWSNAQGACVASSGPTVAPTLPPGCNSTNSTDPVNGCCAHSPCQPGVHLTFGCSPAVNQICAIDSYCCTVQWDSICVNEVASLAHLSCPTIPPTPTPNPLNGTCAHSLCHIGVLLTPGCSPAVNEICQVDPFCCETEWDRVCVSEVASIANLTCPTPTPTPAPTTPPPVNPLLGNCSHSVCTIGVNLTSNCSPAAHVICSVDPFCCNTEWDRICISEVASVANLTCPKPTPTPTPAPTTPPVNPFLGNCSHSICTPGVNLTNNCSPAVEIICSLDPFCCKTFWDRVCVSEVPFFTGLTCGTTQIPTVPPTFPPTFFPTFPPWTPAPTVPPTFPPTLVPTFPPFPTVTPAPTTNNTNNTAPPVTPSSTGAAFPSSSGADEPGFPSAATGVATDAPLFSTGL